MKVITNGIKERYIIYKLYENIENKIYIGKTTIPIYMRINSHRHGKLRADQHFSTIGWNNVVFEIIDWSYDKESLLKKEDTIIGQHFITHGEKLLNKNSTHSDIYSLPSEFKHLAVNFFET